MTFVVSMAIKFRCNQCNQLLGISHRKAGAVVNCPTCGTAVRVPTEPPPKTEQPSSQSKTRREAAAFERALQDAAQSLQSRRPQTAVSPSAAPSGPAASPPTPEGLDEALRAVDALAQTEPQPAFPEFAVHETPATPGRGRPPVFSRRAWVVGASIAVAAAIAVAFLAGYWRGRHSDHSPAETAPRSTSPEASSTAPVPFGSPSEPPAQVLPPVSLTGRITYQQAGFSIADEGARLIAVPASEQPQELLPADGLRPGSELPVNLGGDAVRKFGGGHTRTAADGSYTLTLPGTGVYLLVVLSGHTHRDLTDPLPLEDESLLAGYFARPRDLIGWRKYVLAEAAFADTKPLVWSYDFGMDDGSP